MPILDKDATTNQPIERPTSLKDAAYRQIKGLLLSGQLEHERLYSAQHFAEMLGVSRTPVREALLQLTSEGFLVCFDVRGFKVKEFTDKEIRDVFETREVIETHVIKRLVDDLQPEDLRRIERTLKSMRACAGRGDALGFLVADKEFHNVALVRSGNLHLQSIMENIRNHITILGQRALAHPGRFAEVIREHETILEALQEKDKKKAVQAMAHHLATTQSYLVSGVSGEAGA